MAPPATPAPSTPPPAAAPQRRDLIAGLEKGLAVICAFDQEQPLATVTEIARRCSLTRAAARRYLLTLQQLGYVHEERGQWSLSAKVLRLSQSYMNSGRLPRIVQPELHRLAAALKESSSAGVLEGDDVLCIAAMTAGQMVSSTLQPGTRVPAACTANGRVLLAALAPADLQGWVARQQLVALTPRTITAPDRLLAEIERVRHQGYALVDQELEPGLRTLSVPLSTADGTVLAAINVSVNAARRSAEWLVDDALPALQLTQARLKRVL